MNEWVELLIDADTGESIVLLDGGIEQYHIPKTMELVNIPERNIMRGDLRNTIIKCRKAKKLGGFRKGDNEIEVWSDFQDDVKYYKEDAGMYGVSKSGVEYIGTIDTAVYWNTLNGYYGHLGFQNLVTELVGNHFGREWESLWIYEWMKQTQ